MGNFKFRFFRSRWVRTFLVALVIALVVWVLGPLLGLGAAHPLDSELVRGLVVAGVFVFWLVYNLIQMIRGNRKEKELAAGIAGSPAEAQKEKELHSAEEVAIVGDRLREALKTLKSSKLGGKKLSLLPWYMFIGPPGAGKTTALINCGLKFPLADKEGPTALRGVGGTRNCEWWFTDEAVLIDTAGRYTTQDSAADVDSAGWLGFLRMLKKNRRRQPINGVIVAVSLSDLSQLSEEERQAHAKAIRRRVRELHDELGVRAPVYVLFTKADLIAGFVEFFETLGKEEREQVWGATFALDNDKTEGGAVAHFGSEFDLLIERLNDRMLERVHQEPDIRRRRLIYGFPQQVASLREVAQEFLQDCFRPSRLEPRAQLRGVYLTSGTQDGTPIDRLLGTMANEFGLPRQAVGAFSGTGRSYFLTRLVREVVFGEAALVSTDPKVERRIRWTHAGAYATAVLVLLLLVAAWTTSYYGNRQLITEVHAATTRYAAQYDVLLKRGSNDIDLPAVVPPLDTLRGMHGGFGDKDQSTPVALTFGLYQGAKLGIAAGDAYDHALNRLLLPRLLSRLETQIQASMDNADSLYSTLKVYLILGARGPMDKDLVLIWLTANLVAAYPGDEQATLRDSIQQHVAALIDTTLEQIPLNEPLIAQARAVLTREPLAQYTYNRILRTKSVQAIPAWSVAEFGGPEAGRVFRYHSGKPLDSGVPGIFTWSGYHNSLPPIIVNLTRDVAEDSWVLGRGGERDMATKLRDAAKLRKDVVELYLNDYVRRWDTLLADVEIKPFQTLQEGLDQLSILSAPSSPMRDLMTAIDTQTVLSRTGSADQAQAQVQARAGQTAARLGRLATFEARTGLSLRQNEIFEVFSQSFGTDPSGKPIDPTKRVDEHFRALHDWVIGTSDKPSPMETAIQKMGTVYSSLNQVANAPNQGQAFATMIGGGAATGSGTPAQQLQEVARAAPPSIAPMLQAVAGNTAQVTSSGASRELTDAWRTKVLPKCDVALNRYPLVRSNTVDTQLDDFVALLGPSGEIQKFFDQYLKPFVDTTQHPWKWQSAERAPLGLSQTSLLEFEHAGDIRDSLFPNGATTLLVRFQLTPVNLDPAVGQISVDIGGKRVVDNHGPSEPMQLQWPGADGQTAVRVTMTPASGSNADTKDFNGPWALLRMLDAAKITPTSQPDKFRIQFTGGGGTSTFDLTASSVRNPFNLAALRSFRCPAKL